MIGLGAGEAGSVPGQYEIAQRLACEGTAGNKHHGHAAALVVNIDNPGRKPRKMVAFHDEGKIVLHGRSGQASTGRQVNLDEHVEEAGGRQIEAAAGRSM